MKTSTIKRIISRANSEMHKAGLQATVDEQIIFNTAIQIRHADDSPHMKSGWIFVFVKSVHITIIFGNLHTGENFACFAVKPDKQDGHFWCSLSREILIARMQRELFCCNKTSISNVVHTWAIRQMENQNDK